ncbi:MAG: glycosyltransferase [Cytophagaceae bacterium]|nr:glycosyltransferase [Cytophagaceae bacterium]
MGNKRPIVFHIPKWYPNRYDSLLGVFVKRHILSTMPACLPVVIHVMASQSSDQWYELEDSMEDGIKTYRCYYKKNITGINALDKFVKLLLYFWLVMKLYRLAKRVVGKPNVIHAHILLRTAVVARMIQVLDRVPYVVFEHASVFIRVEVKAFNAFTLSVARYVVRKASVVITVSECLAKRMRDHYGLQNKSYEVIYNCVNTEVFNEKEALPHRTIKEFVYVAEFDNNSKNITGLFEAIASLYQKRKDFRLSVVGYGKDEAMLLALSEKLGVLNTAVFFKGKLSAKDVAESIKQADALLMFSNFETLSCIITESLCCGTPVISTAVGGIVEIINPDNGLLVPKADQEAMQLAIVKLIENKVAFDKHAISQHAYRLFSNQAVGEKLVSVYKRLSLC